MAEYRIKFNPEERNFHVIDPEGDEQTYGKIPLIKMIREGTGGGLREVKLALDRVEENHPRWATVELLDIRVREQKAERILRTQLDNPVELKEYTYYAIGVRKEGTPFISQAYYSFREAIDRAHRYAQEYDVVSTMIGTITHITGRSLTVTKVSHGMEITD